MMNFVKNTELGLLERKFPIINLNHKKDGFILRYAQFNLSRISSLSDKLIITEQGVLWNGERGS